MKRDGEEDLPDHLRCSRNDGRKWRCVRRVMVNKKLCKAHFLQARHRQNKEKVPDSLKLQRSARWKRIRNEKLFDRFSEKCLLLKDPQKLKNLLRKKMTKKKRKRPAKKMTKKKSKRSAMLMEAAALDCTALLLELMGGFLRRQMERKSEKRRRLRSGICGDELLLDLPNGLMAISRAPVTRFCSAGFFCDRKLELDSESLLRRCFRSKNVKPL